MTISHIRCTSSGSGARPSRGLSVSRAALKPFQMMKSATAAPAQPSMLTPHIRAMSMPSSTTRVATRSERESLAVARIPGEFIFLPTARL